MPNRVSTIIPVHNRPELVAEAMDSVLDQTHRELELVVVDDGSTDHTRAVIKGYQQRNPDVVRLITQPRAGPGPARNAGLAHASGEFIQYLDSDDLLHREKFAYQVALLRKHPKAGASYCRTLRPAQVSGAWQRTGEEFECLLPEFLMDRGWSTISPLWRRSVVDTIGPWADFRVMEDWHYDCRAGLLGIRVVHADRDLATMRDHSGSRASGMGEGFTTEITRDYYRAHEAIYRLLIEAGLCDASHLAPFSRKLFWIARMCGARGLEAEAQRALGFARAAARTQGGSLEMALFTLLIRLLGWRRSVALGEGSRRWWRKR